MKIRLMDIWEMVNDFEIAQINFSDGEVEIISNGYDGDGEEYIKSIYVENNTIVFVI